MLPQTKQFPSSAAAALAAYMSELSEEAAEATWLTDWEYILWRAVEAGPSSYGRLKITEGVIGKLKNLAEQCGGWIVWRGREYWLAMDEWKRLFCAHEKSH